MSAGPQVSAHFEYRIGRILRSHGLGGELVLQFYRPRRLEQGRLVRQKVRGEQRILLELPSGEQMERTLVSARWIDPSKVVVSLDGLADRNGAEALEGAEVDVDPLQLPEALCDPADACFGAKLVNDETGDPLGQVTDIRDNGAQPVLVAGDDDELLIPFVEAFIVRVDPEARIVRLRPIPGLLELNRS